MLIHSYKIVVGRYFAQRALFLRARFLPRAKAAHASRTHDGNMGYACVEVKASIET